MIRNGSRQQRRGVQALPYPHTPRVRSGQCALSRERRAGAAPV